MLTTLNLDSEILEEALVYAEGKTKTELINEALREFVRVRKMRQLLEFDGRLPWDGDIDELRGRT